MGTKRERERAIPICDVIIVLLFASWSARLRLTNKFEENFILEQIRNGSFEQYNLRGVPTSVSRD